MKAPKPCANCGTTIVPRTKHSHKQWTELRYCSPKCGAASRVKVRICECGCGEPVPPSVNWQAKGRRTYLPGHGQRARCKPVRFDNTHQRWFTNDRTNKAIAWARVVMENKLGRMLEPGEVVHHANGDKADDRPENLILCASQSEHMRLYHPSVGQQKAA